MTRILWYIVVIATTLFVLILLWQFRIAIVLFLLSLALAGALRPMINNIMDKKFSKPFALTFVYTSLIGSILLFVLLIGSPFIRDLERVSDDLVITYERIRVDWSQQASMFKRGFAEQLPPSSDLLQALTSDEGQTAREGVLLAVQEFFSLLGYIGIIITLSLYWSADQLRFERLGLSMFPPEYHAKALHSWRAIEAGLGAYIRSELMQGILAGFFLLAGYLLLGVRYPVLLAVWGAVAGLIPWFGVVIAAIPLVAIGLGALSITNFLPALYTVIVLMFLKLVVEPRFIRTERYNSLSIILFVVAMAEIFGIIGVLFAPILAVGIQILFQELYPTFSKRLWREPLNKTIDLRRRLQKVRMEARRSLPRDDSMLLNRTARLLQRVREYILDQ